VFDGRNESGYHPPQNLAGIVCRFSHPPKTADDLILQTISQADNPQNITLVTSDRRLAALARAQKAGHVTVEDFYNRLTQHRRSNKISDKPSPAMSRAEFNQWLDLFKKRDKEE
ncbi:NYN domain-containing protein, partial [candidate division KSB1 bacterium]|nr:NYN domain-containing protein [candidate division KSB1 bacterium]